MSKVPIGPRGAAGPMKEHNNHPQGRSGAKSPAHRGPAAGNRGNVNPTKGGGINRKPNG